MARCSGIDKVHGHCILPITQERIQIRTLEDIKYVRYRIIRLQLEYPGNFGIKDKESLQWHRNVKRLNYGIIYRGVLIATVLHSIKIILVMTKPSSNALLVVGDVTFDIITLLFEVR